MALPSAKLLLLALSSVLFLEHTLCLKVGDVVNLNEVCRHYYDMSAEVQCSFPTDAAICAKLSSTTSTRGSTKSTRGSTKSTRRSTKGFKEYYYQRNLCIFCTKYGNLPLTVVAIGVGEQEIPCGPE